ncbi:hypothetical protein SEUCBS140593_000246 [Sporothrix eucalyptigena]|uniref:Amidase domain-containing protein n=1 Tax=Sporothrix eucalyptigena TaxID=1812306 RepID=A0ABP0AN31_9PEZI
MTGEAARPAPSSAAIPPLKSLTLAQVAKGLDAGAFTVVQVVQAHLDQISRFDGELHAVLQLNPNALDIARALDAELADPEHRRLRPLHGVPLLVKDNVATGEPSLEATAGSLALLGAKPARENAAVTRLRNAGCVLLGTTNCSEWANFRSRPSDSGWSARGGQTYAAYHEKQDPFGSSSGSGVAVDMGFCVLAIGTETSGSIISPAVQNNIVGLKPTTGLVSRDAVVPISPQQDTLGPMARTVADAAAMLSVMAGRDEHDPKTDEIPFDTIPNYGAAASINAESLLNIRIGIPRDALEGIKSTLLDAFETRVVAPLRDLPGVTIVDCSFPGLIRFKGLSPVETTNYMAGEFHDALPAYLETLTSNPQNIDGFEALCKFIKNTPEEEYGETEKKENEEKREEKPGDVENTRGSDDDKSDEDDNADDAKDVISDDTPPRRNIARLEQTQAITRDSPEFDTAKMNATYFAGPGGIQGALNGNQGGRDRPHGFNNHDPVDALLLPTNASAANYFAACEGHPQITVPLGYRDGKKVKRGETGRLVFSGPNTPYGVSVIGRKYGEATILPLCATIEALTKTRDQAENRRLSHLRG